MKDWVTKEPDVQRLAEIERRKACVESLLNDYEVAIKAAANWYGEWKLRQPKGFRAVHRRQRELAK